MSWESVLNPSTAESQRAELVVDLVKERPSLRIPKRNIIHVVVSHVVTAVRGFVHMASTCGTEGLNSKEFALFHFNLLTAFDNWYTFSSVNFIWADGMSAQIFYTLYLICLVPDVDLVRFHHFLDGCTDVAEPDVDTCVLDALVGRLLHCSQQVVELRIECHRKCAVNNLSIDLSAKVYFAHVVVAQDSIVTWIRSIMCCAVVDTAASWESNTSFEAIGFNQPSISLFNALTYIYKLYAWSHDFLGHLSHLSVAFSCLSEVIYLIFADTIFFPVFGISDSLTIKITRMVLELTTRKYVCWELLRHGDGVVDGLLPVVTRGPIT